MRFTFNLQLPQHDLFVGQADMRGRSLVGFERREDRKFFPLVKALECLTAINVWQWERFAKEGVRPKTLYQSGVYYKAEPTSPVPEEEWQDFPTLYAQGFGDCEDLACARAGELQYHGIPAVPAIKYKMIGELTLIHVLVLWPNGTIEDPSLKLGMKGEYR